ncbi:hypothetical protein [Streptomyces albipurpureus]|uniref:Uncharacterized protein n=1 Tax=Streptomyces albipurpureus TaxID=2897419 RepID=A0ABT0UTC5_9ACTN|nr:hypothetical protein [Streptomyces sp. CWNU-1]MCM2391694.1 hypothetical protein [Streptomyces sp. CWNU-1]
MALGQKTGTATADRRERPKWTNLVSLAAGGVVAALGTHWSYVTAFGGTPPIVGTRITPEQASVGMGLALLLGTAVAVLVTEQLFRRIAILAAKALRPPS